MRRSLRDAFVGFSLLGGLVLFSGAMLWLRDFRLASKTWEISASFKDASGLAKMSPVTYRGIIVGSVQKISFTPNTVETKIKLNNDEKTRNLSKIIFPYWDNRPQYKRSCSFLLPSNGMVYYYETFHCKKGKRYSDWPNVHRRFW